MSEPPASGVAVGAIIAPKCMIQTLIEVLDQKGWRKRARVSRVDDDTMAVALMPEGARALDRHAQCPSIGDDDGAALPAKLARLLGEGGVRWASGMRVGVEGAPAAAGAAGAAADGVQYPALAGGPTCAPRPETAAFRFAELFAGIGGFRLGLDAIGGCCVFASEIDPFACATYESNFGERPRGDITEVATESLPEHDVLTAGFPCQSFSRAGEQAGLSDNRGDLFYEIIRVARARRPSALILENVPNLLRLDDGHTIHVIMRELAAAGYHARLQLLNALAFVPQHRERLFIVAFRSDLHAAASRFEWPWLPACRPSELRDMLEAVPAAELGKYRLTASQWDKVRESQDYQTNPQWRLAQLGGSARTLRGSYRKSYLRFSEFVPLDADGRLAVLSAEEEAAAAAAAAAATVEDEEGEEEGGEDDGGGDKEGAAEAAAPRTATVAAGSSGHEASSRPPPRFYTERECARLQGFPDSLSLQGAKLYIQLGNAVNPLVVQAVGKSVLAALRGDGGVPRSQPSQPPQRAAAAGATAGEGSGSGGEGGGEGGGGGGETKPCEELLCAAAINLLRGVTPPRDSANKTPEPGAEAYGRYGHEQPAERARRVRERPAGRLFCMRCAEVYGLQANASCTPCD